VVTTSNQIARNLRQKAAIQVREFLWGHAF